MDLWMSILTKCSTYATTYVEGMHPRLEISYAERMHTCITSAIEYTLIGISSHNDHSRKSIVGFYDALIYTSLITPRF